MIIVIDTANIVGGIWLLKRLVLAFALVILLSGLASSTSQNSIHMGNNINFEVPSNWSINNQSDTSVELTDGNSSIRIDLVKLENISTTNETWNGFRFGNVNCTAMNYYVYITKSLTAIRGRPSLSGGQGGDMPGPLLRFSNAMYRTNYGNGNVDDRNGTTVNYANSPFIEWYIAWKSPEFEGEFVGIYSVFYGESPAELLGSGYWTKNIPTSLYSLLRSFNGGSAESRKSLLAFSNLAEPRTSLVGETLQSTIYSKHNISFQIPANWSVVKDSQDGNDTQVVMSDGSSAIRIDLVQISRPELDKIAAKIIATRRVATEGNVSWKFIYQLTPWYVADAVLDHYKTHMSRRLMPEGCKA